MPNIQKTNVPSDGLLQKLLNVIQGKPGYAEVSVYPRRVQEVQGEGGYGYQIYPKEVVVYDSEGNPYFSKENYKEDSIYDYELENDPKLKKQWNKKTKGVYGGHGKIKFEANGGNLFQNGGHFELNKETNQFEWVPGSSNGYSYDKDADVLNYNGNTVYSNGELTTPKQKTIEVLPASQKSMNLPTQNTYQLASTNLYRDFDNNEFYKKRRNGTFKKFSPRKQERLRKKYTTQYESPLSQQIFISAK